ncbi:MAG: hypothetical protein AB7E52_01820 [Bdellovibrionales bacterium]
MVELCIIARSIKQPSHAGYFVRAALEVAEAIGAGQIVSTGNLGGSPEEGGRYSAVIGVPDQKQLKRLCNIYREEWGNVRMGKTIMSKGSTPRYRLYIPA